MLKPRWRALTGSIAPLKVGNNYLRSPALCLPSKTIWGCAAFAPPPALEFCSTSSLRTRQPRLRNWKTPARSLLARPISMSSRWARPRRTRPTERSRIPGTLGAFRRPASLSGVVGLKPTYGRVSRYGLIAFGSSLDQIGPLANSVEDAARILGIIAGRDPNDSTSSDVAVLDYVAAIGGDVRGLRVGVPREYYGAGLDSEVKDKVEAAIRSLEEMGAEIVDISLPNTEYAVPVYYLIATAEASSNLARFDGVRYGLRAEEASKLKDMYSRTRDQGFGAEVKRRIMLGTYALSAGYYDQYYGKAQKVRSLIERDFRNAFSRCDVIATPTAPTAAFKLGEKADNPLEMYLSDIYTITANLAGVPGLSMPCGLSSSGLPIGIQ